ncbi:MAG TPA: LysE family translocator [Gaiellaceae bacterium]|jgi:threonine/homoserine/homoserine lactone efflux protein|nr:LysE family translocator [Gaiellaceae bacterium]
MVAAFVGISIVVIVTPGQDTALTIRNSLLGGRRAGIFTAAGVSTGQAVWALATSVGIAALIVAFEPAFVALRLAGAAFLVYLGVHALLAALRGRPRELRSSRGDGLSSRSAYRQGVISNLGNPKMAVFFTSLLPQFGDSFPSLLALGLVFCSMTFVWLTAYAFAVARAGDVLRRPAVRRAFDAVLGVVLVALGLRLATDRR